MTEVRCSESGGHLGLFALKDFSLGDVILEENPVVRLAPPNEKASRELLSEWKDGLSSEEGAAKSAAGGCGKPNNNNSNNNTLWSWIKPPPSNLVPGHLRGTFKGMVQAGIVFIKSVHDKIEQKDLESLLDLYYPTAKDDDATKTKTTPWSSSSSSVGAEKCIIDVAEEAILFLKQHVTTTKTTGRVFSGFDDWDKLRKILLIWACNSFQGGRVYPKISRVNHSCNPNALIQTTTTTTTTTSDAGQKDENFSNNNNNNEGQKLLAATKIKTGTEICISYLGLFLYTDTTVRRKKLERTKFFRCACARCTDAVSRGGEEGAARIPCPKTHPRDSKTLSLDEDVQYDDDQSVKYTCFVPTATAAGAAEPTNGGGGGNDEDEKLRKVLRGVCNKIELFLDTYDDDSETNKNTKNNNNNNNDDDDEEEEEKDAILEEHASLASTMMGDRHWTTNLTLLLHLDRRLKAMSRRMILTQELPEEDEIAEAIDSLQRVYRFVDSLHHGRGKGRRGDLDLDTAELNTDPGHLLGDVTIGTARMLISLGDVKSQKYGADWLGKIEEYVDTFCDPGVQKVVSVLKAAWKKHNHGRSDESSGDGGNNKKKKAKVV